MLFILRQLRRSFFQPGKLKTYIAYAVGEIALIVVSILIAVEIGDRKERGREAEQCEILIRNLKKDFQNNVEDLVEGIKKGERVNQSLLQFLEVAAGDNQHLTV